MGFKHPKQIWYAFLMIAVAACPAHAGTLKDREFPGLDYPYSDRRDFYVYVPDAYDGGTAVPMVMVLHGCHQNRDAVFDEFGWDEVADTQGVIVVAPDISTRDLMRNPKCWGYWEGKEIHQGKGEVEDLHRIGRQVEAEWRIDPNRRHIAGLSSGGFMANAAAVAHNEYWASIGVHSGGGYNESVGTYSAVCGNPRESSGRFKSPNIIAEDMRTEMDHGYGIPMMLIHSTNDCSVGYGVEGDTGQWGGLTSNRDAWLAVSGGAPYATEDCSRDGIGCRHRKYGFMDRSTVEVVRIEGLIQGTASEKGHYWSGGKREGEWTRTRGPKAALLFWDFFRRHPRTRCKGCPATPDGLMAVRVGHREATLAWQPNQGPDIAAYHLYRDGQRLAALLAGATTYTDTDLQPSETFTYTVAAVNGGEGESFASMPATVQTHAVPDCSSYTGTIALHVVQGRAYPAERCRHLWCWIWPWPKTTEFHAKGSDEDLGNDDSVTAVLYTRDDDHYTTTGCGELE